jgi:diguanylate cyclase (GGDEF)-like protein
LVILVACAAVALLAQQSAFDQSGWALIRPMPLVTLEIRKVVGILLVIPAFTQLLLYLFRPRPYVFAGVATWLAASVMLLSLSIDSATSASDTPGQIVAGKLAIVIWASCAMIFGASARFSGMWFRAAPVFPKRMGLTVALLLLWIGLSSRFLRPGALVLSAFLLMTVWQIRGAIAYAKAAREHRFVGAMLASVGLIGITVVNVAAATVAIMSGGIGQASTNVAYYNGLSAALVILGMHLLIFEDVIEELRTAASELARGRDEMRTMAVTDPLTGCYNRRFLDDIETHELEQHKRYGLALSLLYIDIDHFKAINDTRGHDVGDRVLKTLGEILRSRSRLADFVLRWGGDEFLVLLSADEHQARAKADEFRHAFLQSEIIATLPHGVDLSIGVVAVPPETESLSPLIDRADSEMYRRKSAFGGKK